MCLFFAETPHSSMSETSKLSILSDSYFHSLINHSFYSPQQLLHTFCYFRGFITHNRFAVEFVERQLATSLTSSNTGSFAKLLQFWAAGTQKKPTEFG